MAQHKHRTVNRRQFKPSARRYFEAFDRWTLPASPPNIMRDMMTPEEIRLKGRQFRSVLDKQFEVVCKPYDWTQDWDKGHGKALAKMELASLYYLFTGDLKRTLPVAIEGFEAAERCDRKHFTYSSCLGVLDMDLRTAHVAHGMAMIKSCFGDLIPVAVRRRMSHTMVTRILAPGLEAERNKTYPWMHSKANWRQILCGGLAMGGMVFAEDFPEYRELMEYAIEGVLVGLETGDRAGGWNEGPGYWNYGLGFTATVCWALRVFTGGEVDLFRHPFLQRTSDFWLYMHTRRDGLWNWSDGGKTCGPTTGEMAYARADRNPVHQQRALALGVSTAWQVFFYDPSLPAVTPEAAGYPRTKLFPDLGVQVWRTGFGDRDTYIGLKAGDIVHYNHHCHLDMGSLVVYAAGRELLSELNGWPYPYEGRKDPTKKGYKPGFYDIDNKRWLSADFDSRMAVGHNGVMLEGDYPQLRLKVKSRFLYCRSGKGFDATVMDSTPFYTPLARRVRRHVVFVHPDVMLVVDEILARRPVRARLLFHYPTSIAVASVEGNVGPAPLAGVDARLAREDDAFTITNGPAQLRMQSLYPKRADHLIVGHDERVTTYLPPAGLQAVRNRFVYIENLYRKPRLVFVSALQFGRRGLAPATFELEGAPSTDNRFSVIVRRGRRTARVAFDLDRPAADVG